MHLSAGGALPGPDEFGLVYLIVKRSKSPLPNHVTNHGMRLSGVRKKSL